MRCFCMIKSEEIFQPGELLPAGLCVLIAVTQIFHLAAIFLNWKVSRMAVLWSSAAAVALALIVIWGILLYKRRKASLQTLKISDRMKKKDRVLAGILMVSVFLQMLWIMAGDRSYAAGDMTLETVRTFLATDQVYSVNPLTGQAYAGGIPLRLKILCLPSLYACTCRLTGLDPELVVLRIVPVAVLICSYCVYGILGRVLFKKDRAAGLLMLIVISLLYWCGDYMDSMDGFLMLHCGYRGIAVRNCVLVPFTIVLCLKKKWYAVILTVVAEACIVWTLYGLGACLAVAVLLFCVEGILGVRERRRRAECRN